MVGSLVPGEKGADVQVEMLFGQTKSWLRLSLLEGDACSASWREHTSCISIFIFSEHRRVLLEQRWSLSWDRATQKTTEVAGMSGTEKLLSFRSSLSVFETVNWIPFTFITLQEIMRPHVQLWQLESICQPSSCMRPVGSCWPSSIPLSL